MTTYTITQDQLDLLTGVLERAGTTDDSEYKWDTHSKAKKMLRDLQPNTQEPCAWMDADGKVMSSAAKQQLMGLQPWNVEPYQTPLYTHPAPQAKPLTDEQITEIAKPFINTVGDYWCNENAIRDNGNVETFARAIEAAHNIKG